MLSMDVAENLGRGQASFWGAMCSTGAALAGIGTSVGSTAAGAGEAGAATGVDTPLAFLGAMTKGMKREIDPGCPKD